MRRVYKQIIKRQLSVFNKHVGTTIMISAWLSECKCTLLHMHDYDLVPPQ